MQILLSNDDGYQAEGLRMLADALAKQFDIAIVAPERDRSGASNSLTLDLPIRARRHDERTVSVDGTPTDCVHLGITGLLEREPDIVISGINAGANLGDDVLYSGTVAAATEGRFLGYSAMAVSLAGHSWGQVTHYATAVRVVVDLLNNLDHSPVSSNTILNINVPDIPHAQLSGYRVTRLGHRHRAEPVIKSEDPRGRRIYWIGPPGGEQDAGQGTDFHAVRNGYVSITPLQVDLTHHESLTEVSHWLSKAGLS